MKKFLVGAFLGMFAVAGVAVLPNVVSAQTTTPGSWANPNSDVNLLGDGSQKISSTGSALLDTIKNAINWILGILATVALAMCLYGGFLMVTSAGDEKKYSKGLGVLKYAAIGLAIIGLSWMIISVIFWFINTLSGTNTTQVNNVQTDVSGGAGTTPTTNG